MQDLQGHALAGLLVDRPPYAAEPAVADLLREPVAVAPQRAGREIDARQASVTDLADQLALVRPRVREAFKKPAVDQAPPLEHLGRPKRILLERHHRPRERPEQAAAARLVPEVDPQLARVEQPTQKTGEHAR